MEIKNILVDRDDSQTGYAQLSEVVAEITKVINKGTYVLVGLRDFSGQEITALIRGRTKPNQNDIGKVAVFKISGKSGNDGVRYSGFYNPNDPIPQQYAGKKPVGGGAGGGVAKGNYDGSKNRGVTLSYAKDLAVAGVITLKQLQVTASLFAQYVDTGQWPLRQGPVVEPEREVPEADDLYGDEYSDSGYENNATETKVDYPDEDNPF